MTRELFKTIKNNNIDKVKELIKAGVDVNAKNEDGWTALMIASCYGYKEIVDLLIKAGTDVNAENIWSMTALLLADGSDKKEIVKLLIKAGGKL